MIMRMILKKSEKLGDAIAISNLKLPITDPLTDWLTGVGAIATKKKVAQFQNVYTFKEHLSWQR